MQLYELYGLIMVKIKARFELRITAYRVRVDLNVWEINRIFASHDIMGTPRKGNSATKKAPFASF